MNVIRDALYDKLNGQVSYGSPPAAVPTYAAVPEPGNNAAALPYIVLGESTREPFNTDTSVGAKVRTRVEVYSGYFGAKEAEEIIGLVRTKLDRVTLSLSGCTFIACDCDDGTYETTEDHKTRRASVDVVVLVDNITTAT